MSFVIAVPGTVADAAGRLAGIASAISAANTTAAAPTTAVVSAAEDEVSAAIARVFSEYASAQQALGAQAAAFHAQLVQTLGAGAGAYAATEAANASPLQTLEQDLLGVINAPTDALIGRPLIGNGANGTTNAQGVGTAGQAGGILMGNGGNGGASTANWAAGGAGGPAGLLGNGGSGGVSGAGGAGGTGGAAGVLGGVAGAAGASTPAPTNSVLLTYNSTSDRLLATISVGSNGPSTQVIVDTGSTGLILPPQDVNTSSLTATGQTGTVTYGGTLTETFKVYDGTVNFGNGISTSSNTPIAVVTGVTQSGVVYAPSQAPAILGIGIDVESPLTTSPLTYLPGTMNQGVLLNEPTSTMTFGANTLLAGPSISPAPVNTLKVVVDGTTYTATNAYIDSGGLGGDIPSTFGAPSTGGYVSPGTTITVENSSGTTLYSYTVGADQMSVSNYFNSGIEPFLQDPIYLSNTGSGTMYFDT